MDHPFTTALSVIARDYAVCPSLWYPLTTGNDKMATGCKNNPVLTYLHTVVVVSVEAKVDLRRTRPQMGP